ncbi:Disease resistance protein CC-NBS-LRR class family, partial [Prunus dulcis]
STHPSPPSPLVISSKNSRALAIFQSIVVWVHLCEGAKSRKPSTKSKSPSAAASSKRQSDAHRDPSQLRPPDSDELTQTEFNPTPHSLATSLPCSEILIASVGGFQRASQSSSWEQDTDIEMNLLFLSFLFKYHWISNYFIFLRLRATQVKASPLTFSRWESLVTPIGREFGYLIYYDTNMKDLKDELKQLFEMKDGVQELVNAAKRNGEVINSDVQSWLTSVNKLIQKVLHFEEEVNMKRRFLYRWNISKKATKITQDVRHLQKERTFNNNVAHPAPPPMIWSTFKEGFKDFKSRMTCVNSVIEVLKNEEVRMIGICGMGGVGKTTMVKEIIKRLAGLKVFDNVVIAVVSQSPSIRKIQSEIAEQLGFTYDKEDTESGRARRLYGTLMEISRS